MDDQVWPSAAICRCKLVHYPRETFSNSRVGDWDGGGVNVERNTALGSAILGGGGREGEEGRKGGCDQIGRVDEIGLEGLEMVTPLVSGFRIARDTGFSESGSKSIRMQITYTKPRYQHGYLVGSGLGE